MIDTKVLETNGWILECKSPFEIRHKDDGSMATGQAARIVYDSLTSLKVEETMSDADRVAYLYQVIAVIRTCQQVTGRISLDSRVEAETHLFVALAALRTVQ
jgi:hypothetical protein